MRSVDRELVERLLEDQSLSFREIARRANCSDWSVRAIAREVDGSDRTDAPVAEPLTLTEWGIFAAFVAGIFGGIWLLLRMPPPEGGAM